MRDCPTRDGKQVAPNVSVYDARKAKACFYALWTRGLKPNESDDNDGKFLYIF